MTKPHSKSDKTVKIELLFKNTDSARAFVASWLDGGGEQTCRFDTIYEKSDDWTKNHPPKYLFLDGPYEEEC